MNLTDDARRYLSGHAPADRADAVRALAQFDRLGKLTGEQVEALLDAYPRASARRWYEKEIRAAERRILAALFPATLTGDAAGGGEGCPDRNHTITPEVRK